MGPAIILEYACVGLAIEPLDLRRHISLEAPFHPTQVGFPSLKELANVLGDLMRGINGIMESTS
jgi:hypothetical protein